MNLKPYNNGDNILVEYNNNIIQIIQISISQDCVVTYSFVWSSDDIFHICHPLTQVIRKLEKNYDLEKIKEEFAEYII